MSTPTKRIAFHTMGCKLNFSETSAISRDFLKFGFIAVDYEDIADIYVLNSCSVTSNADKEARKLIRRAKRRNPLSTMVVTGCYAQLKPQEVSSIEGVDMVVGSKEKFDLIKYLDNVDLKSDLKILTSDINSIEEFIPSYSCDDRTRSFLKIQDGCNYNCSFCTIPLARGRSRSNSIKKTIKLAKKIEKTGAKEIVLTGVNIGDFGVGTGENLIDLLKELDKLVHVKRIRISSIEPNLLTNEIIQFCESSKKFMPHYHIPLQSGSDKILGAMRRRYDTVLYKDRINKITNINPEACIGVDVIVGFPGESDEDFLDTYNFLNELDITYLHVFTYSERRGTEAVQIREKVQRGDRSKRSKILRDLSREKQRVFNNKFINTIRPVLFEGIKNGYLVGYTDNYIKAQVKIQTDLNNQIVKTSLIKNNGDYVIGSI